MKPWRERIAEARERGGFTSEDFSAWMSPVLCLVGEVVRNIRGEHDSRLWVSVNHPLGNNDLAGLNRGLLVAIGSNDFDFVERRLEEIEDHAMYLKREGLI